MTGPSSLADTPATRDIPFTDKDFALIAKIANDRYGLFLQPAKRALVYSRLAKRLRKLQVTSFEAYCALLERPEGQSEQKHLLSALTTNVTHFFREMHHFTYLKDTVMPGLAERARAGEGIRLWSSACSYGQEAYCMAATVIAAMPDAARYDIKVLATDIDPNVVAAARQAQYPADQLTAIPAAWRKLVVAPGQTSETFTIRPEVRNMVSFGELNLISQWPMKRKFDVIFCRNAAIYFDKDTQARLWSRFADLLRPGGYLLIGHSERLSGPAMTAFANVDTTTYQRLQTALQATNHQNGELA